ncbi:MAG: OsmC family protein [Longimicrobiales bacterium]
MIRIRLLGGGDCDVEHAETGTHVRTSKSAAFGGTASSFSSTDLLAAALGSCIATDLEPVAERNGVIPAAIRIDVEKTLSMSPKRIESIDVRVTLPTHTPDLVVTKLERAAEHCLVHRGLNPEVDVRIRFQLESQAVQRRG